MASRIIPSQAPENTHKRKSDFIENQLLKAKSYTINDDIPFAHGNKYIIGGVVFTENIKVDTFREFQVYKLKMDDYADTSGVSIDDDTHLELTLEPAPYGMIVNSNVYLTHNQWNTVYQLTVDRWRCAVCDVSCDVTEHVATSAHVENMGRCRPLNKYDLTITRKINNNFHCGVCNTLFDVSLKNAHYSSKTHENKLLFAINKVSDIMYDYNLHNNNNDDKKDSYHFNAKAINNNHHDSSDSEDDRSHSEEEYDYNDYNYNYNDQRNPFSGLKYNDDGDFEEPAQSLEFSYASMAKKPKTDDLPEVLEVDLGNKKVTVKFNSWNMLIRPMANRFYCMACRMLDHARRTADHCNSAGHLARLAACSVVDEYDKYFVRQVDDKCYHCGHCNNLQLINAMEHHIRSHHTQPTNVQALLDSPAKKISTPVKTNPAKHANEVTRDNELKILNDNIDKAINETKTPKVFSEALMYEALRAANGNFEDIVICTFGSKLRISKLAFNIVCQGENDFYCGICEMSISKEYLKHHVTDAQHLDRLQRTPFIRAFNVHLFREIRDALHCALCNELIQIMPEFIVKHKYLEKHIVSLNRALGCIKDNTAEAKGAKESLTGATSIQPSTTTTEMSKITTTEMSKITTTNGVTNKVSNTTIKTTNNVVQQQQQQTTTKNTTMVPNNVVLNNIPARNIHKIVPAVANKMANTATANINKNIPANNGVLNISGASKEHPKDDIDEIEADIAAAHTLAKSEEFTIVKNGVKEEIPDELEDSFIDDFDIEEYVYVKLGNSYIKITNTAFNTLVDVGDGGKYCFVCSALVNGELSKHVESRGHTENMEKFKFIDKYNEDLLRQFYLMYHCSICNVVITRKQLNHHLTWPTHAMQTENTKISSKKRKNEIKSGTKQITITTQKEDIYLNEKETDIKVHLNIAIDKEGMQFQRMNKIVIFNDNVLKVSFDCWHSVSEVANGYRCKVCQSEFGANEFGDHVSSERHKGHLDKIEKQYSPALIRKINDTTLNCVMCNTEVSNKKHIVTEHIQGKKHIKHYEAMLKESSVANSYADCDQDVLML